MEIKKSNHVTKSIYWTLNQYVENRPPSICVKVLRFFKTVVNKIFSLFRLKISRYPHAKIPRRIMHRKHLGERNKLIARTLKEKLPEIFSEVPLSEIEESCWNFDIAFSEAPITNLQGGFGYNNSLILFATVSAIKPKTVIESGVWRGFTTYIIDRANVHLERLLCFDINLSLTTYRSPKALYFECDLTSDHHGFDAVEQVELALYDDHTSHLDRLKFSIDRGIKYSICDDDLSWLSIHTDGWPPIPTANMIFDNRPPSSFEWILDNVDAVAHLDLDEFESVNEVFVYRKFPELFEYTGIRNKSLTSILIQKL